MMPSCQPWPLPLPTHPSPQHSSITLFDCYKETLGSDPQEYTSHPSYLPVYPHQDGYIGPVGDDNTTARALTGDGERCQNPRNLFLEHGIQISRVLTSPLISKIPQVCKMNCSRNSKSGLSSSLPVLFTVCTSCDASTNCKQQCNNLRDSKTYLFAEMYNDVAMALVALTLPTPPSFLTFLLEFTQPFNLNVKSEPVLTFPDTSTGR